MKTILYLFLALPLWGAPAWIPKGGAVPVGLVRVQLNSPTQSMAPAMTGREVCWFEPYAGQEIRVGDLVWFVSLDGRQILHEVTAKNKRAVYTSGSANREADGWTPNNRVRFILRFIERPAISHLQQVR